MADEYESTDVDTAEGTEATEQDAEPQGQAAEAAEESSETPEAGSEASRGPSRASERIRGLVSKLNEANSRLKEYESLVSAPPATTAGPTPNQFSALEPDADGEVLYHGQYVTVEYANHMQEIEQRLDATAQSARKYDEDQHRAQVEKAQAALYRDVEASVISMRESNLPQLPKDITSDVDEILLRDVDNFITRAINEGKQLSPELIVEASKTALARARRVFGAMGEAQIKDNQQYAETHKVRPGGLPGVKPPKTMHDMTQRELEDAAMRAFRNATA